MEEERENRKRDENVMMNGIKREREREIWNLAGTGGR